MKNQDITFESQGWFKTIQQIWLALLVIVALSLAVSSFTMTGQAWYINALTLCMVAILVRMGYMQFKCNQYFNTRLALKNEDLLVYSGKGETRFALKEITCDECPVSNVYKLSNSQTGTIIYFNGFLPHSKQLADKIRVTE